VHEVGIGMSFDHLSNRVIGCCIEVHKQLGPGLLESAYEECLAYELRTTELGFTRQKPIAINYKGVILDCGYRLDFLIENQLIIELKSIEKLQRIHHAQLLSYMKLANIRVGLLINFNNILLRDSIKRFVL
jgi:GxxExxY protein